MSFSNSDVCVSECACVYVDLVEGVQRGGSEIVNVLAGNRRSMSLSRNA